jgi:hypothetical protein
VNHRRTRLLLLFPTPGVSVGSLTEVFGELHANDEVAVRGTDELQPGTAVVAQTVSNETSPAR